MSDRLRVAVLGSTGSIGRQALEVAAAHPDRIEVVGLAANSNVELLVEQAREFGVAHIAVGQSAAADRFGDLVRSGDACVGCEVGAEAVEEMAAGACGADMVLNALVGAAGLRATLAVVRSGALLALANKESLVVGGDLVTRMAQPGQILPVDSEHSAIFQCYLGENAGDVSRIWLTASGGPFRGKTREELESVTAPEALAHPTWMMGPKITIDSATLMNKGLEVIEARHLFGVGYDAIRVVVHPQSCVHSMVEFRDGSVKAHLGATDMRIPIQYAFSYPDRWDGPMAPVDFVEVGRLEFLEPDTSTFGCLELAVDAGRTGGSAPVVLNAANEIAVESFLAGRCGFLDIERVVGATLDAHSAEAIESVEQIEDVDAWARRTAMEILR